jgi:NhaA family Na+:H+ antiporter
MPLQATKDFLKTESAGGILLMFAAGLAMIIANSPLVLYYDMLLGVKGTVGIGSFTVSKPTLLWINDFWMAIFFLLIGLEVKREIIDGELRSLRQAALPAFGALGGMVVPVGFYLLFNMNDAVNVKGWAIPAATDIAFALGLLSLFGSRVPLSLKVFLATLAIFDDLAAIVIIALFYTSGLSLLSLGVAAICVAALVLLNFRGVDRLGAYFIIGAILWVATLKSGVHATLAGVVLAFFIPYRDRAGNDVAQKLEHDLHPWVAFLILPAFAFANAGVSLAGITLDDLLHPVALGIALGLFAGKQLGVFLFSWVAVKLRMAERPSDTSWTQIYGAGLLCGVGFTMSLFIGSLAFEQGGPDYMVTDRLGILGGSLLSALAGMLVLKLSLKDAAR